jgi:ABC-type multidrug transport system ATPase subunit
MCRLARDRKGAMLISSHQLSAIEDLCDIVGILDNKKLHILNDDPRESTGEPWVIATENASRAKEIIERATGSAVSYSEDAWHVTMRTPRTTVPEIVALLVRAGCRIQEVRPEKQDLKGKIRTHYEKT